MTELLFQTLVQFAIDTETGDVKILKKFTTPIKGSQGYNYKKKPKQATEIQEQEVRYL